MGKADEIKKYHELLSVGAITENEYNKAKEKILHGEELVESGSDNTVSSMTRGIAGGAFNYIGSTPVPVDVCDQVDLLMGQGNKIQAIKCLREATGLGLADAKQFIESHSPGIWDSSPRGSASAVTPSHAYNVPPQTPQVNVSVNQPKKKKGCLSRIVTAFVVLIVLAAIGRAIGGNGGSSSSSTPKPTSSPSSSSQSGSDSIKSTTLFDVSTPFEYTKHSFGDVIYSDDYTVTYDGSVTYTHNNMVTGNEYYVVFEFTVNNTSSETLDYDLVGYNMRGYQNLRLLEDATYTMDDNINGYTNIHNVDEIKPGMSAKVYVAFEITNPGGLYTCAFDTGYMINKLLAYVSTQG